MSLVSKNWEDQALSVQKVRMSVHVAYTLYVDTTHSGSNSLLHRRTAAGWYTWFALIPW